MRKLIVSALCCALLAACGEKKPEDFTQDKTLFEYASKLFDDRSYGDAIPFFESLRNRFPQSPYAVQSELKIADAHFAKEDYLEAELAYRSFRALHPSNEKVPYAVYRTGMSHFKRKPKSPDRDQSEAQKALESFEELANTWPDAPEAREAPALIEKCRRSLASRELYVANFYLKQHEYAAALVRLKALAETTTLPDLQAEANYKIGYAHFKLKAMPEAKAALTKAAALPGPYAAKAQKLLREIP